MTKRLISIEDLAQIKVAGDPQVSPDGTRVLYTLKVGDVGKNKYYTHLWMAPVNGGSARQFTFGEVSDNSPRWSPDGQTIAFIRSKDKKTQIWRVAADGGEPRALTEVPEGGISDIEWSPNGRSLAFSFRPTGADWTRDAAKKREESGQSKPARAITRVRYRLDGQGFHDERQHIWVCDATTGKAKAITHGAYDDAGAAWSPDSKTIAFVSNRRPEPERQSYRDDIWLVAASGGRARKLLTTPIGSKGALAWSPDGRQIAYIGTASKSLSE